VNSTTSIFSLLTKVTDLVVKKWRFPDLRDSS